MKTSDRIVLVYTLSAIGAGAFAFWRGKRGKELYIDMALHGAVAGTAINMITWLVTASSDKQIAVPVNTNPGFFGSVTSLANSAGQMSKMGAQAKNLLGKLDIDALYEPFNMSGVEVGPVPSNEFTVTQKPNPGK